MPGTPPDRTVARPGTQLRRGLVKHCARCGSGHLYDGWFRMREHCPRCGVRFEREEGFFTGAYLINFAVTEGLLFVALMVFVGVLASADDLDQVSLVPIVVVGLAAAVGAPVAFYPFSRTIWFAIHLAMAPLDPPEIDRAERALLADLSEDG